MVKISDSLISKYARPRQKPAKFFDAREKGYGIRIGKSGKVSFIIDYQLFHYDPKVKKTIDKRYRKSFEKWDKENPSPDLKVYNEVQARKVARKLLDKASNNKDPFGLRDKVVQRVEFVSDLLELFQIKHIEQLSSQGTRYSCSQASRVHLFPRLGHVPLKALSSQIVDDFHQEIAALGGHKQEDGIHRGGRPTANRCLAILKVALNKAVLWGYIDKNPAVGIKPFKEKGRTRYLNHAELEILHKTLCKFEQDPSKKYKYQDCIDAIRIALMTGCRRGELLATRWENVNLSSTPATWSKPSETTKQGEWEHVPLNQDCVEIFRRRDFDNQERLEPSDFVFPLRDDPSKHMLDLKSAWTTIRKASGLKDFRFHDLRHTFASHMAIQGKSLYVIGKMLGHKNAQTTQRYAKLNTGALEDLANSMSAVVQAAVQPAVPANDNRINQQQERESA